MSADRPPLTDEELAGIEAELPDWKFGDWLLDSEQEETREQLRSLIAEVRGLRRALVLAGRDTGEESEP